MTTLDVLKGVKALLKTKWPEPETAYYTDYAPQGFKRPSFLVEEGPVEQVEIGGHTAAFTVEIHIVAFLPVNAYHHSHIPDLCRRRDEVMALFGRGYFPVGDRNPHIDTLKGNCGYDYAEVTASVSYTERWEDGEEYPLLESINIKIKQKEE